LFVEKLDFLNKKNILLQNPGSNSVILGAIPKSWENSKTLEAISKS